jgi:hypothetical protein
MMLRVEMESAIAGVTAILQPEPPLRVSLSIRAEGKSMWDERLRLLERYRTLVFEHAGHVSDFSAKASDDPAKTNHHLDAALGELETSQQAVQEARERLKQHLLEHGCDGLSASLE